MVTKSTGSTSLQELVQLTAHHMLLQRAEQSLGFSDVQPDVLDPLAGSLNRLNRNRQRQLV